MTERYPYLCNYMIKMTELCGKPCRDVKCFKHKYALEFRPCKGLDCGKPTYAKSQHCTKCGAKNKNKRLAAKRKEQRHALKKVREEASEEEKKE